MLLKEEGPPVFDPYKLANEMEVQESYPAPDYYSYMGVYMILAVDLHKTMPARTEIDQSDQVPLGILTLL